MAKLSTHDVALFLVRAMLATVFMFHGSQKLFAWFGGGGLDATAGGFEQLGLPLPWWSALAAGCSEFFGGLVLLIGTGTRIAAPIMAFTMAVAVTQVHWGTFSNQAGGVEYPLTLGVVLVALAIAGPGKLTIGNLIGGGKKRSKA